MGILLSVAQGRAWLQTENPPAATPQAAGVEQGDNREHKEEGLSKGGGECKAGRGFIKGGQGQGGVRKNVCMRTA